MLGSISIRPPLLLRNHPLEMGVKCEPAVVAAMAKVCTATANPPLLFQHPSHSLPAPRLSTDLALKQQLNVPTGSDVSQYLFVQDWGILHGLFSYSGCPKHCLYPKIALPILFVLWNAVRFLCHCQFFEFPCSWKAKHQKHTRLVNRPWWKSTVRGAKPDIHFGKAWFNSLSKADLCFNQAFSDRQCFLA